MNKDDSDKSKPVPRPPLWFLFLVGLPVAMGFLWFARNVLGLENAKANAGFAMGGMGVAGWIFAKLAKTDGKGKSK